jgi:hypothetical protein
MSAAALVPAPSAGAGSSNTGEKYPPTWPTAPAWSPPRPSAGQPRAALPDVAHKLMPDRAEGEPS